MYDYQRTMIDHIRQHERSALWVEMGLGKTVATLTAIQSLRDEFEVNRTLVVAPLRVADMVWPEEAKKWSHLDLPVERVLGTEHQRLKALRKDAAIHVVNRENLAWLVELHCVGKKVAQWPWDMVVLDESSSFKNRATARFRAIARVNSWVSRMVQLTGTPQPNTVEDLWSQVYLLDGGARLGRTLTAFRQRWMIENPYTRRKAARPGAGEEVKRLTADIALSLRASDYLDLPKVVENIVDVRLTPPQMDQYMRLKRQYILELEDVTVNAQHAAHLWNKLAQLANGTVYGEDGRAAVFHDHKIEALRELHESVGGQMIIAYAYRHDLARITAMLDEAKASYRVMRTRKDERDWNDGKVDRLVLHPASAGHGLNLHEGGCRDLVWFGLTPNLEYYEQTNARIAGGHRAKANARPIVIHKIMARRTQDHDLNTVLAGKAGSQSALMRATQKLMKGA